MSVDRTGTPTTTAPPPPTSRTGKARTAAVLAAAAATAVAVLLLLQVAVVRPALEADLGERAGGALREAGYGGVRVSVDGRDLTASGTVSSGQAAADVETALARVAGVRGVTVRDVQLLTEPGLIGDGVVTAAGALDAVDLADQTGFDRAGADASGVDAAGGSGAGTGGAGPEPTGTEPTATEVSRAPVEGSRLLTSGFEGVSQAPALPALTFVAGSPTLTSDSDAALEAVAAQVIADTTGRVFVIRTHTDSVGASAYNQWLSERRAMVVCDGLLALGVPEERLTITGVGESEPLINPEVTEDDRATNRRVEILPAA